MIQFEEVSLQFGDRILFDDVTFCLSDKYRYIVVGANGSGKSSFLSLIAGDISPTLGEIARPKSAQIGWMRQDHHLYDHLSIVEVVIKGREKLWNALQAKKELLESSNWEENHTLQLAKLEEKIAQLEGYRAEADAQSILIGLGIESKKHHLPLKNFSGGWKMRVLLAQLLFNNPEILLLDEPTNYLDITSISWLEDYLIYTYQGLLIIVSHDLRFLEKIGTCVLDVDYGQIQCYPGTYKQFCGKKEEIAEQKAKEYDLAEAKVQKMERFIQRFRSKPSKAKQCASREKMIERVKWPELGRSSRKSPSFHFLERKKTGQIPLKATALCKIYEPDIFIGPLDLEVIRGEKIAFVGPNGSGKTTFVHMLIGQIKPDEGAIKIGHQVHMSIFYQEHKHLFEGEETVFEWFETQMGTLPEEKRRQVLGALLFRAEDLNKKITMLSGGEMARLLLAQIMLSEANVLFLDEPTNHLDLESKEALAESLIKFNGTVIFVSHDRDFINKVASRVIEIGN